MKYRLQQWASLDSMFCNMVFHFGHSLPKDWSCRLTCSTSCRAGFKLWFITQTHENFSCQTPVRLIFQLLSHPRDPSSSRFFQDGTSKVPKLAPATRNIPCTGAKAAGRPSFDSQEFSAPRPIVWSAIASKCLYAVESEWYSDQQTRPARDYNCFSHS